MIRLLTLLLSVMLVAPAAAQEAATEVRSPSPPPPPAPKPSTVPAVIEGVTCVACPEDSRTFHGANCINGIACAASSVTPDDANAAIHVAMRHLEQARTALGGSKSSTRSKALREIEAALKELQAVGLKTATGK
jgi:hypothetical protein